MNSDTQQLLTQVRAALARGAHGEAERLCLAVLEREPAREDALSFVVMRALQGGDPARGRALAERGTQAAPQSALLQFHLGGACEAAGDAEAARAAFDRAYGNDPQLLLALFCRGIQEQALGRHDEALQSFVQGLAAAEKTGLIAALDRMPAEMRARILPAIATVQAARDAAVAAALRPLEVAHGNAAIARIRQAVDAHLGKVANAPPHPLQRPSFLLVPGLPPRPWFEREEFPFLAAIEQATEIIRAELLPLLDDEADLEPYVDMPDSAPAAPTWRELNRSPKWSAFHLIRHGQRDEGHCARCPRTVALLESLPLMRIPAHSPEALFSVLKPHTRIPPHTGVINGRLTVHLPLIVPENCGALEVGGERRTWAEGRCLVFDDSMVHAAWNDSDRTRVVLIFDIWNPYLSLPERDALATAIDALGRFNRTYGA